MSSVARKLFGLAALCVALGALALSAAPAVAASAPRSYLSQMTGFVKPEAVTIGANDEVWTSDPGKSSVINRYSAFPALTKLGSQDGGGLWGGGLQVLGMSVSASNGVRYWIDAQTTRTSTPPSAAAASFTVRAASPGRAQKRPCHWPCRAAGPTAPSRGACSTPSSKTGASPSKRSAGRAPAP